MECQEVAIIPIVIGALGIQFFSIFNLNICIHKFTIQQVTI